MKCPKCGHETKGKFCGKCGAPMGQSPEGEKTMFCHACGQKLKPTATFCGKCGAPVRTAKGEPPVDAFESADSGTLHQSTRGYLSWNVQGGQIAVKLSSRILEQYANARGVILQEGTRALVYVDGTLVKELRSGTYSFLPNELEKEMNKILSKREGGLIQFFKGAAKFAGRLIFGTPLGVKIAKEEKEKAGQLGIPTYERLIAAARAEKDICVVLVREADFPLVFDFKNLPTGDIRTDVGVQILCAVTDLKDFYASALIDSDMLTAQALAAKLQPSIETPVVNVINEVTLEEIEYNIELQERLAKTLNAIAKKSFTFLSVSRVTKISASREELERLRQLSEELYLSERELDQLNRRNEFANRLRLEENRAQLDSARTDTEFRQQMQEINKDKLVTEDELEKFQLMLANEKRIRLAKTEDEYQAALAGIRKSELLRAEELVLLENKVREGLEDRELDRSHALDLLVLGHKIEADKAALRWEYEVGDKRLELELKRRQRQHEADLDMVRGEVEAQRMRESFLDERRRAKMDLDQQEMVKQLDLARQAQQLRDERKKADHERELEIRATEMAHERAMELGKLDRFQTMTAEQIMAANPRISADAAQALAEKFKAEAATVAGDDRVKMAQDQKTEMKEFMEKQIDLMRSVVQSNAEIVGTGMVHKDREIERAHREADASGDRMARVVGKTVGAIGGESTRDRKCKRCGAAMDFDAAFCTECGAKQD